MPCPKSWAKSWLDAGGAPRPSRQAPQRKVLRPEKTAPTKGGVN